MVLVLGVKFRAAKRYRVGARDGEQHMMTLLRHLAHPRDRVGVVETDSEIDMHDHRPAQAPHSPHDVSPPVAQRHELGDLHVAGRGRPAGEKGEGVGYLAAGRGHAGMAVQAHLGCQQPSIVVLIAE